MRLLKINLFAAVAMVAVLAIVSACDEQLECPTKHIISVEAEDLGAQNDCKSGNVPEQVDIDGTGTVISVSYYKSMIVCKGEINVDMEQDGNELTLITSLDYDGPPCGCFNTVFFAVKIDVCEQGKYTIIVKDNVKKEFDLQ